MELEKFLEAKNIKEELDRLESKKYKLESALKACSVSAVVTYSVGHYGRTGEIFNLNKEFVKEMLNKELEEVNSKIKETKILFNEI